MRGLFCNPRIFWWYTLQMWQSTAIFEGFKVFQYFTFAVLFPFLTITIWPLAGEDISIP